MPWYGYEQIAGSRLTGTVMQNAIAYYRASTRRQGQSGLGLEAQQKSVEDYALANQYKLIYEYIEVKSGKRNFAYGLKTVLADCRKERAVLLIAKLDRLSRSVSFISALMDSKIEFKVVDQPYADRFTLHILAAVAEKERLDISKRTTDALAAAKKRGVKMGEYGRLVLSLRNKVLADKFAQKMRPILERLRLRGFITVRSIVAELNRQKIPTFYQGRFKWHLNTVQSLIVRLRIK